MRCGLEHVERAGPSIALSPLFVGGRREERAADDDHKHQGNNRKWRTKIRTPHRSNSQTSQGFQQSLSLSCHRLR
jgi:hypothetical protein